MVSQKKQVKRLKKDAQRLWDDQQALLSRASSVARDAWPHAQHLAKGTVDQVVPGARSIVTDRVAPVAEKVGPVVGKTAKAAGAYAASTTKDALSGTLLPAVSSAAAAAIALAEEAGERLGLGDTDLATQGKKAAKQLGKVTASGARSEAKARAKLKGAGKAAKVAAKQGSKQIAAAAGTKKGLGVGGVLGILLGVGLLAGIGYAVWQTLRADDDLWVADEDPDTKS